MKINLSGKEIFIIRANSFIKKLIGLMFKKNFEYGLLIPKCNSVHTFFMRKNIDVIALDENNKIIYINRNVPKNKIVIVNYPIKKTSVLELPANTSLSLNIGDTLSFECE